MNFRACRNSNCQSFGLFIKLSYLVRPTNEILQTGLRALVLKLSFELDESFPNFAPLGTTRIWNHQCNDFSSGCEVNPHHGGARQMNEPLA